MRWEPGHGGKVNQPTRLREAGVELREALPVGLFRSLFGRADLRLHRKIVVVDGEIAWTGSMNMVDPRFFKQESGVGQWVDAMVRARGNVVLPLAATLIGDWILETPQPLGQLISDAQLELVELTRVGGGAGDSIGTGRIGRLFAADDPGPDQLRTPRVGDDHPLSCTRRFIAPSDPRRRRSRSGA